MARDSEIEWGCAAMGRSGNVQIDVDEACSGPDRWQMSIDHPQLHMRFAVAGPQLVGEFLSFLQRHWNQPSSGELALGSIGDSRVCLIKDDEFSDRFSLCLSSYEGAIRYTLNVGDIRDYVAALQGALEDLDSAT